MVPHVTRRRVLAAGALALAGCTGSRDGGSQATSTRSSTPTEGASATVSRSDAPPTASPSLPVEYDFETLREAVRSGGPPKDGIPSVDEPTFVPRADAPEWLNDEEVVFGLVRGDDVKAYPQRVLVWHEICNDVVDGDPVSVTYCPLTGTAMGFERGSTTFGVSGKLLNSNLVMYDRETDSSWPQMLATAVEGEYEGAQLREFPLRWTTWGAWREAYPETAVLTTDTGYIRSYDRDPYGSYDPPGGYYVENRTMFEPLETDDRLGLKDVVVGTRDGPAPVAFPLETLRSEGTLSAEFDDGTRVAVYDERLDVAYVYRTTERDSVTSVDAGTVTLGDGSTHDAAALPYERRYAYEAMWFAWYGFYPGTVLAGGGS